jgi:outer membrane protein assembly factor BamB
MLSRWLRWLVVTPVLLFVFGAILLSCSGGSSSGTATASATPGFALAAISIEIPPSPTASATATATSSITPKPTKTPKPTVTATLTPSAAATSTNIVSSGPDAVPTGGPVSFIAIGTFKKKSHTKLVDITMGAATLWTSTDNSVFQSPATGAQGGVYTTGFAGCVCILASSSGVSSQFVSVGVYEDVNNPAGGKNCVPSVPFVCPLPGAATGAQTTTSSTAAASARNAGVLMWTVDPGAELRGRIAVGADGSIFFITRDGVLHGVNSKGKEVMRRDADGSSPALLPDGTVIAMSSKSELGAFSKDGAILWHLEIGDSAGPLATTDRAIYASAGGDLVSISSGGSLNWRVNVGSVTSAAATPDGVVAGASRGAVTAVASDGAVLWTFQPDGGFSGSVAYSDDVVYAGSVSGGLYAIDSRTGNPLWHVNAEHAVTAGPAVAPSGTIFAGSDTIYGVTTDGQVRWKDSTLKPGDGGLIVLGYDGAFDATTDDIGAVLIGDGSKAWTSRSFGKITTAASSASGMLYVGTSTGRIFAVR